MRPDNPTQGRVALPATPGAPGTPGEPARRSDWATLQRLLPYLWRYKWRVMFALGFMVAAKVANVSVPLLLKELVDAMTIPPGSTQALLVVPVALLLGYGALRLSQLLSYTAGLPSLTKFVEFKQPPSISLTRSAQLAAEVPLASSPGTQFDYGGANLQFLGAAAEQVTGKRWQEIFDERIAAPTSTMSVPSPSAPVEVRSSLLSASSAKMPPSPRLSARRISSTYFSETTTVSVQNISDSTPWMFSALSGTWPWAKTSLKAYSGLVPMSP
mgnify:CR=1 FL=1